MTTHGYQFTEFLPVQQLANWRCHFDLKGIPYTLRSAADSGRSIGAEHPTWMALYIDYKYDPDINKKRRTP